MAGTHDLVVIARESYILERRLDAEGSLLQLLWIVERFSDPAPSNEGDLHKAYSSGPCSSGGGVLRPHNPQPYDTSISYSQPTSSAVSISPQRNAVPSDVWLDLPRLIKGPHTAHQQLTERPDEERERFGVTYDTTAVDVAVRLQQYIM